MATDLAWMDRAACQGTNIEIWFPMGNHKEAEAICAKCKVQKDCLEMAMSAEKGLPITMRTGVYGGFGPRVRAELDKVRSAHAQYIATRGI